MFKTYIFDIQYMLLLPWAHLTNRIPQEEKNPTIKPSGNRVCPIALASQIQLQL